MTETLKSDGNFLTGHFHMVPPRALYFGIFAVSGFSGLIYESIWAHYLKLFLGHAAYAQSLVLIIFMGGMALGSWLASRRSRSWKMPILAYAVVEAIVGVFALGFHTIFTGAIEGFYVSVLPDIGNPLVGNALKFGLATALIAPQSVLLGMTFPLMSSGIVRRYPDTPGASVSMLYFTNSIGAALGVLVSGFWLIGEVGLPGTIFTAGLLNFLLALTVVVLLRLDPNPVATPVEAVDAGGKSEGLAKLFLVGAFVTGMASFIYEIAWIRMLSLVLGSTTHSFELMLSAFIAGLALGGLWIRRRIDKIADCIAFSGYVQILMAVAAVLTLPVYYLSFEWMQAVLEALARNNAGYLAFTVSQQFIAFAVMLPATFLAGMTLPLFTFVLMRRDSGEAAIGRVYAANTLGAIVGVLFAVHIGLPILGLKGLIVAGAIFDLALGAVLLSRARKKALNPLALVAASALAATAVLWVVQLDPARLASGVYRHGDLASTLDADILFYKDGKTASISLKRVEDDILTLATNGKPDASISEAGSGVTTEDESTMVLLGSLPHAYKPDAKSASVVGFGSGLTTHVLLLDEQLERVDTIEIEPKTVDAARGFGDRTALAYNDPRSHIHIEDAKTFFSLHNKTYDLIVAEPSNPWVSGVSSLFSSEFYATAARHLDDDGIFIQWLQLYEFNEELVFSVLKSLSKTFADFAVYSSNNADLVIVAARADKLPRPDYAHVLEGAMGRELEQIGITRPADFSIRWSANAEMLQQMFPVFEAPANSDYFPFVDTHAGKARYLNSTVYLFYEWENASLPIVEMLRREPVRFGEVTPGSITYRLNAVSGARSVYSTVTGDDSVEKRPLPREIRVAAELVANLHRNCELARDPSSWQVVWSAIAPLTLPFLEPALAERLVMQGLDDACMNQVSPEQRDWISLYRAVARRDATGMSGFGQKILAYGSPEQQNLRIYALTASVLGLLHDRRPGDAIELLNEVAESVYGDTQIPNDMQLLIQFAIRPAQR